ncbi:MAG: xylulokinase, partial [Thermoprotei archaeon]|nr:xylulokinase [Thermoprotei archaeon]
MSILVGIDIGTGGCKTVAFDDNGHLLAEAFMEYPVLHPKSNWAEQNPKDWWKAVCSTLREITSKVNRDDIVAVGLTSQREAFVPLDKDGKELYNSIIWLDSRAIPQKEKIERIISREEILKITGVPVDYIFSAPKLLWIKENLPKIFEKIDTILFTKDYIAYKLCEEKATDYTMASRTMLFDIRKLEWSQRLCEILGIPMGILPPVKGSWEIVGEVTGKASEITGLPKGIPVISGGGDRPCEALGAGVIEEGEVNIGTGTGTVFEVPLSNPRPDPRGLIDCCCHVVPNTWEYEIIINSTGESLRWFRDNFGYEEVYKSKRLGISPYDIFNEEASKVELGSGGLFYYPYLWGARAPKFDPMARGVFIGFTHSHRKPEFIRAIMEGVAFQYVETIQLIEELGVDIRRIVMTGGEAKSDLWNQIKA